MSAARFGASHALQIVSEDADNVFKHAETSERLWRSDVPILIFLIEKQMTNIETNLFQPLNIGIILSVCGLDTRQPR
jgi:hypothetical protein